MMAVVDTILSDSLSLLHEQFNGLRGNRQTTFSNTEIGTIAEQLKACKRLAVLLEKELGVHRLGESNREVASLLEDEAGEQLDKLARDPTGVVISPDFGRKQ